MDDYNTVGYVLSRSVSVQDAAMEIKKDFHWPEDENWGVWWV
jgi:hypothetical protein